MTKVETGNVWNSSLVDRSNRVLKVCLSYTSHHRQESYRANDFRPDSMDGGIRHALSVLTQALIAVGDFP